MTSLCLLIPRESMASMMTKHVRFYHDLQMCKTLSVMAIYPL